MNQYLQQLNNLAAQNEGGGDPPGGQKLPSGIIVYPSKEGESWVYKDKDGKVYGKSLDQQIAMAKAVYSDKRGDYSGDTNAFDIDESKVPKGFFVERDRDEDSGNLAYKIRDSNGDVRGVVDSPEKVYNWAGETGGIPQSGPEFEVTAPKPEWMVRQESSKPEDNFNWNVTLDDPSSPTGRRVSKYNLPPTTESDIMDVFHPNEEDSGITVKGFNLDVPKMSPRVPQPQVGGQQPLQAGPDISGAVLQGAAQQSGGGIVSNPNATAGSAAVSPQGLGTENKGFPGERRSRGGGATWEAPGEAMELTQEDFYPTPEPMVGQYDTGNEYVARSARMPMGALSKAAATLQNRQVELDQKRQAFQEELYKPVKTAAPYQQNFNTIVNRQREDFLQKVAQDLTGGNVNKAYREIYSNPRLRAQWRELNTNLEALGQRGSSIFARAEQYMTEAAKGGVHGATPEMRKLASDLIMGLGGYSTTDGAGGNFEKLISNMNRFETMLDRNQYFKDNVVDMVKNFAQRSAVSIDPKTGNTVYGKPSTDDRGRYMFWNKGHLDSFTTQIKQLARTMALDQGYGDGDLPEERIADNEKFLTAMLADKYNMDYVMEDKWSGLGGGSSSSSSSGDGGAGKLVAGYRIVGRVPSLEQPGGQLHWIQLAKQAGANVGAESGKTTAGDVAGIDELALHGTTSGEARLMKPKYIGNQSVIPVSIFRDQNGRMFIRGKVAGEPGVRKVDPATGKQDIWGDQDLGVVTNAAGEKEYTNFERLKDFVYPFNSTDMGTARAIGMTAQQASDMIDAERAALGRGQRGAEPVDYDSIP